VPEPTPPRRPRPQQPYDLSPRGQGHRAQDDDLRYWSPRPQQPRPPRPPLPAGRPRPDRRRTGPEPRPPSARRRRATIAARALACTASATLFLASAAAWSAYHNLTSGLLTSDAINEIRSGEKGYVAPHLDGSVNLLLIGLDSRKDMNGNDLPTEFVEQELHAGSSGIGGYNTNVLIFMHIPADGGRVTAFSIARDDYVEEPGGASAVGDIPDLGMHKIKEAYGRAKAIAVDRLKASGMTDQAQIEKISREVGRESTIRAVQLLTGEHVDHLAEINLLGF
jgi:anionic cell wall polymer biosynthesis LytR-Cps2A-Psr (LCP) family protein